MSYATTASRPNPLAAIGALGLPATFGAILIIGLAASGTITLEKPNPKGLFVPTKPAVEPPPPEDVTPKPQQSPNASMPPVERPTLPPIRSPNITLSGGDPITVGTGINENWGSGLEPLGVEIPAPRPTPVFDPVAASPRGNPANWITTNDYRSSWIRRELTGTARFTLQVDASGKVSGCTVTGSTGHEALDRATCSLIQGRAVFNPAKGSDGKPVAGRYSSSVNWSIPE